jgi:hypothetical protein
MLAPFVQDLLIACTVLLLAAWANDVIVRWIGLARQVGSPAAPVPLEQRRRSDRDGLSACGASGLSGDWLFKLDHSERN